MFCSQITKDNDTKKRQNMNKLHEIKMPIKEIAEQLNLNSAFVKVQKKRCMDNLKEQVKTVLNQAPNKV